MSAEIIKASVLVFPDISPGREPVPAVTANTVAYVQAGGSPFSLSVAVPHVVTLSTAEANSGDEIQGTLHFPDLQLGSACRNISSLPATTLVDDLYPPTHVIAFAPWSPGCNREFLDSARDDRSDIRGFFFYTRDYIDSVPEDSSSFWDGLHLRDYTFPIYAMRGREGIQLMDKYAQYAADLTVLSGENNMTGRARIYIEVDTGKRPPLPGLWLFLLIVLGVLAVVVGLTSLSMHLIQFRRRRSLRRRVAAGQVDLEALGVKRLTVPRKLLDKLPLRTYTTNAIEGYEQQSCSICLEDYVADATTIRQLPCKHVYHPVCIDGFLEQRSSLCPLCKASVLPGGYVPPELTNRTVRRERNLRRQREREAAQVAQVAVGSGVRFLGVFAAAWASTRTTSRRASNENVEIPRQAPPRSVSNAPPAEEETARAASHGKFQRAVRAVFPGFR